MAKRSASQATTQSQGSQSQVAKKSRKSVAMRRFKVPKLVSQGRQPFAPQQICTLVYAIQIAKALVFGAYAEYKFSCNGLFDPDTTGGGHQPMYFDQLMAIYNHYCVLNSSINVTVIPEQTTTRAPTIALFQDDDATTGVTDIGTAIERPGSTYMSCQGQASGMFYPPFLRNKWKADIPFPGQATSKVELQGDSTTNPTEQTFWIIGANDAAVTSQTLIYNVRIEYTALFFELKSMTPS